MATFSFAEGGAMFDSTPIENLFLLEHLPTAPDAFLRVYLYARVLALHPELGGDFAQMARALRMSEDTVYDAFAYWEQQGLVRRLTDRPPTYELIPARAENLSPVSSMERDYYAYRDFNASLQALFGAKAIESHEYRIANDWLNVLGYEQDAALKLVEYGIRTSRVKDRTPSPVSVFKRMDRLAATWADRGCRTLEDVERAIAEDEGVYPIAQAVLKRFNLRRKPTLDELDCAKRWLGEWGFTQDEILAACEETTKSRSPSFAYLDAILKNRKEENNAYWGPLCEVLRELNPRDAQPTPDQLESYGRLLARGFEPATVKLAAVQSHRKKRTRFDQMERLLDKWAEHGAYTAEAAEAYIRELQIQDQRLREIYERCGIDKEPGLGDAARYDEWRRDHDDAVIDYAAACARGMDKPMLFMDKLLKDWAEAGVRTVAEAEARREAARAGRAAAKAAPGTAPANPALDYEQREYRDEDFGDDFFFDVVKEYGNGGDKA